MEHVTADPDSLEGVVALPDDAGTRGVLHRRRLDLRAVRRLVRDAATPPLIRGDTGGIGPRATVDGDRPALRAPIGNAYAGPGGDPSLGRHPAHGFRAGPGRRLRYGEDHC